MAPNLQSLGVSDETKQRLTVISKSSGITNSVAANICCGPLALICCLPKYNKTQELKTKIDIELAKPL
ncbi:hypothetical protein BGZ72_006277 [Mortierella alpina]|nr:hypothetical protein BGZ72_006277 [Mortierella alpina]